MEIVLNSGPKGPVMEKQVSSLPSLIIIDLLVF
jgi:hypothetical protein